MCTREDVDYLLRAINGAIDGDHHPGRHHRHVGRPPPAREVGAERAHRRPVPPHRVTARDPASSRSPAASSPPTARWRPTPSTPWSTTWVTGRRRGWPAGAAPKLALRGAAGYEAARATVRAEPQPRAGRAPRRPLRRRGAGALRHGRGHPRWPSRWSRVSRTCGPRPSTPPATRWCHGRRRPQPTHPRPPARRGRVGGGRRRRRRPDRRRAGLDRGRAPAQVDAYRTSVATERRPPACTTRSPPPDGHRRARRRTGGPDHAGRGSRGHH